MPKLGIVLPKVVLWENWKRQWISKEFWGYDITENWPLVHLQGATSSSFTSETAGVTCSICEVDGEEQGKKLLWIMEVPFHSQSSVKVKKSIFPDFQRACQRLRGPMRIFSSRLHYSMEDDRTTGKKPTINQKKKKIIIIYTYIYISYKNPKVQDSIDKT